MENKEKLNAPKIILLLGAVFGVLIAVVASGTFVGIVTGLILGLAFAGFFINVIVPYKASDR